MSHVRTQIRDQLAAYLGALATTGANVFTSRPEDRKLQAAQLPALLIYTDGETLSPGTMGGPQAQLTRELRVRIQTVVRANTDGDNTLDTVLAEVEAAVNASDATFTVNALVKFGMLLETIDDPESDGSGEVAVTRMTTNWVATYRTAANAPTTAI